MLRLSFIFLLLWLGASHAEEDAFARYKNLLPEQILNLTDDERSKSVPIMFNGAANLATSPTGKLVIRAQLNTLMYRGLADYEGATKAFQADLGEEATGVLTVWQIHRLGYRASRTKLTEVSFFPYDFGGALVDRWARVQGTATIIGERVAYPINHVRIDCSRDAGTCDYRQTALILPDENSWLQSYNVGVIADETYKITRWEGRQIDAVPVNNTTCRTNQLSFNFETGEFFEIVRNRTAGDCETSLGVTFPRLEKPRISQIVDGRQIISAEFQRINAESYSYLSSAFRAQIEALSGKQE